MSLKCHKCSLMLSTQQKLQSHLNRKNPCDRKCPDCDYKGPNARQLKKHRLTHDQDQVAEASLQNMTLEIEPIKNVKSLGLFPLDDFQWQELVNDVIVDKPVTTEDLTMLASRTTTTSRKTVVETVTLKYTRREYANNIRDDLNSQPIFISLKGLNPACDLVNLTKQLMYNVHSQPNKPRFHSICKSDVNRGNISTYNRIDDEKCKWITHGHKSAPTVVNDHGRNLVKFLLQAGINILEPRLWVSKDIVVLFVKDDVYQEKCYVIVVYFDVFEKQIRMERTLQYESSDFMVCPMTVRYKREMDFLIEQVEARKHEIIEALNQTSLNDEEIENFLNNSRPICIKALYS